MGTVCRSQKDKLGFKLEEFDGVDTRLAGKVEPRLTIGNCKQDVVKEVVLFL